MLTTGSLLLWDGIINLTLGLLLLVFPSSLVELLGVPQAETGFYPGMLGAVLAGIGVALLVERSGPGRGLALPGAIAINLSAGAALAGWLLFGKLDLPRRGSLFLLALAVLLVGISAVELCHLRRRASG